MERVHITSSRNPLLKQIRKAVTNGTLTEDGYCVAETYHLLDEAIRSNCEIRTMIVSESARLTVERLYDRMLAIPLIILPDELFAGIAATETTQGVLALVRPPEWRVEQCLEAPALALLIDGLQDPGNAGTLLRSAEAFGCSGVLLLKGSVSPYNPKAIRASAGSIFRVPVVTGMEWESVVESLFKQRIPLFAAMPAAEQPVTAADFRFPCAIAIGNEARGVRPEIAAAASPIRIPTANVESLNAAVAGSVLLYEASRQRQAAA